MTRKNYGGLRVGDEVLKDGYAGNVSRLVEWDKGESLVEVRLDRGVVCTDICDLRRPHEPDRPIGE